ncbi:unnamed protein product [Spirodela intermedia]|uniref:Uncharacterized protein n=1 Tax=Spirodela intermedia TaxID=51605 RepID=A0A7I8J144_SPIIN|nr:unnamed protein product [Spirodela intermedia]CAA6663040.1 unnamed protein product [Spirodela intermedia]
MAIPNQQPLAAKESSQKPQLKVIPLRIFKFLLFVLVLVVGFSLVSLSMSRLFGIEGRLGFLPCLDEPSSLNLWMRPPRNLMHGMTDEELIWRASLVPQVKDYPFKRVPKVAFMFLTKGPLPWNEKLYSIYIHSLPSYSAEFPKSSPFYGRQIPSQMSMCDAERRLLANALLDISNERFVLLSETCIPLVNFSLVHRHLLRARHSFVSSFDDHGPYGRGRYNPRMAPEVDISQWRKGSQWFEVDRQAAIAIIKDTTFYPKFKEFCRPNCYVDEHYFPTMLSIEMPQRLANRSVTWVDWSRGGAHPATFGGADITEAFLRACSRAELPLQWPAVGPLLPLRKEILPSTLPRLLELAPRSSASGDGAAEGH